MSILLNMLFEKSRWEDAMERAVEKEIDYATLRLMCKPQERLRIYRAIRDNEYNIAPPKICLIPKDKPGEYREVKANEPADRVLLTLINDCLMELFPEMTHKSCVSYQKGKGTQITVTKVSKYIQNYDGEKLGYKSDLSKYFDSVNREIIMLVFDLVEAKLGVPSGSDPVINLLRRYYNSDWLWDLDRHLVQMYTSLKQGCAVAAFLSNVILYDIDEQLTQMCDMYVRYSDDMLMLGNGADEAKAYLEKELVKFGLKLNPKKVEELHKDKWFTFLGFSLKGNLISLSRNRIKKFQKSIEDNSIKCRNKNGKIISSNTARRKIINYLYGGKYNWATSCLGILNAENDVQSLNNFIMDCIRACETKKTKLGGLGYQETEKGVVARGKGRNVRANKENTSKKIDEYISVNALRKAYQTTKPVYEVLVMSMR